MRNIFVRLASFIWVVAVPQTFAQLGPELPLRRALFYLILFSHSPQSFNLHSHVSISKLSVRSCVSEFACVHVRVCMCVCVCVCVWSDCLRHVALELRLEAPLAASQSRSCQTTWLHAIATPTSRLRPTLVPPSPLSLHAAPPWHSRIWQLIRLMAELFLNALVGTSTLNGESF